MSWIDRINAAIVRRIHGKVTLRADEHGVELYGQHLAYADLQRAVAYHHPEYIGNELAVALDFGGGRTVIVGENDDAWKPVLAALDRHPRCRCPSTEWLVVLVAAAETEQLELLD